MDLISRQATIDALWKALFEYEDKTEKQFQESKELDVSDWFLHRIFVQNMNDIDRQTILNLPSTQQWIPCSERLPEKDGYYLATCDGEICGEDQPFTGLAEYENRKWVDDEDDYQCVLAWMPLPEPWKGEEDDSKGTA